MSTHAIEAATRRAAQAKSSRTIILEHIQYLRRIGFTPEQAALSVGADLPQGGGWDDLLGVLADALRYLHGEATEP